MKLSKAPEIDGLTVEFYRTIWPFLKHFAVTVFNNCYVKEELSNTQKIGLISLIYKQKNDPLSLDNYRPITHLNIDTKILAYTLAQRIKPLLHKTN
jgi:hypothetical protein